MNKNKSILFSCILTSLLFFGSDFSSAQNRVHFAGKDIFLSGINAAWVSFAADVGPGPADLAQFRKIFQTVRDSGGNAIRLWLYTNGSNAPEYNSQGYVSGPGTVAIENIKQILDLAHHYHIGLVLCLWSFDMLRKPELDTLHLYANKKMLTDSSFTNAFITNALVPTVDSLKGDSSIIAWEVCNEPNGMTTGTNYYAGDPTVPDSAVQRFTNLIAGAIHRADPNALVTTGPGNFQTLTDVNPIGKIPASHEVNYLSTTQLRSITENFNASHRDPMTVQQMKDYLKRISAVPNSNIYRDDRLIAAGGDSLGTLDFYCVHYYSYGSTALSPFTHPFSYWGLNKPTVVAEFYMANTDGTPDTLLFPVLYTNGYAGALAWSWTDFPNTPNNKANAAKDTWTSLRFMKNHYRNDVDPFFTDFPRIAIISPKEDSSFIGVTELKIAAAVIDTGSSVSYVEFFSSDGSIGKVTVPSDSSLDTLIYTLDWKDISPGNYTIYSIAENSAGQQEISASVRISFGALKMTRLEAEGASTSGPGFSIKSDPAASGGVYYDVQSNDINSKITWTFSNGASAGTYPVSFGFKLYYASPKTQYINVNGVRTDTVEFSGSASSWLEKTINVNLVSGKNTVQMQMFWGWMYIDYLAVPSELVTDVAEVNAAPVEFDLSQNYPNPFNPATSINYQISKSGPVSLKVTNVLGQTVKTLVDEDQAPGNYTINFNADNLASGIYFFTLRAGSFVKTKKMILLK